MVRAALAILLLCGGCDSLFGLRKVHGDDDVESDAAMTKDAPSVDAMIDADTPMCTTVNLVCSSTVRLFSSASACYVTCSETVDRPTAMARCIAWGGNLAIVDTPLEDDTLQAAMGNDSSVYFIGMTQGTGAATPSAGWRWNNGTAVTNARWYVDNLTIEPNDGFDNVENGEEQCGWYSRLGWGDGNCSAGFQFICEK